MERDQLQLFDCELAARILSMEDEDLWEFVLSRQEQVKQMKRHDTGTFYALPSGLDHFRKCFLRDLEDDKDLLLICLINDFCFLGEPLDLSFQSVSGFLDGADSCNVATSEHILPQPEENLEAFYYLKYFHLLEPAHLERIIFWLKLPSVAAESDNTEQINEITKIKNACAKQNNLKAAFIYDV